MDCRAPSQEYDRDCLLPTVKYEDGSVIIWAAVSSLSVGPIVFLKGRITGEMYREISPDQVHSMMQTLFPAEDKNFQDYNSSIQQRNLSNHVY